MELKSISRLNLLKCKKSQLKYHKIKLHTIENLLTIKDMLKTLP